LDDELGRKERARGSDLGTTDEELGMHVARGLYTGRWGDEVGNETF